MAEQLSGAGKIQSGVSANLDVQAMAYATPRTVRDCHDHAETVPALSLRINSADFNSSVNIAKKRYERRSHPEILDVGAWRKAAGFLLGGMNPLHIGPGNSR